MKLTLLRRLNLREGQTLSFDSIEIWYVSTWERKIDEKGVRKSKRKIWTGSMFQELLTEMNWQAIIE